MANQAHQAGLWPEVKIEITGSTSAMGSFGERMQREREMRNISLDEIATSSKISSRMLRALEEEDFDKLPGGIFNKGFVRSYARYLGIDEEQAVSDYAVALKTRQQSANPGATANEPELLPAIYAAKQRTAAGKEPDQAAGFMIAAVILVVVLGVGGFAYKVIDARRSTAQAAAALPVKTISSRAIAQPQPVVKAEEVPAKAPETAPVKTADATALKDTLAPVATKSENSVAGRDAVLAPIVVVMTVKEASWVQVTGDGKVLMAGNISPDSQKSFRAAKEMVIKLGNAAGVELSYNGKPVSPFETDAKMKTLTFTPDGLK